MSDKKKSTQNDSSTDFFLRYMKKEKETLHKQKEERTAQEEKKLKIISFINSIYNPINKILDHILASTKAIVLLSIILTVIVFITTSGGDVLNSTTSGTTIKNVAVEVEGLSSNYEVSGIPDSVTIGLIGPSMDIYTTQLTKNYSVYVDLADYKTGTHTVTIKTRDFNKDLTVVVLPETTTIKISPKVSKKFDIGYKFKNEDELDEKYAVSLRSLSKKKATIFASEDTLAKIDHVSAIIDVAGKTKGFTQTCSVKAYDANDKEVSCNITPSKVEATCRVDSYSKVVAIKPNFKGKLKSGYKMSSYKLSPSTVTIYGKRSDISGINTISCDVDIDGLSGSTNLTGLALKQDDKISKMSETSVDINMTIKKGDK